MVKVTQVVGTREYGILFFFLKHAALAPWEITKWMVGEREKGKLPVPSLQQSWKTPSEEPRKIGLLLNYSDTQWPWEKKGTFLWLVEFKGGTLAPKKEERALGNKD